MVIINRKSSISYIYVLCAILVLTFKLGTVAQTTDITDDAENALLSFTIDETPIYVGNTFTWNLNIENVTDLAGWQCDIEFDPNVLEAVEVIEGDFLKQGGETPFFQRGTIDNTAGVIDNLSAARFSKVGVNGTGKLLSVKFRAKTVGQTQITLSNLHVGDINLETIPIAPPDIVITIAAQSESNVNESKLTFTLAETPVLVGDTFTLHLKAENVTDLAGWECDIVFDPNVLQAVEVIEGDFLKQGGEMPFFLGGTINNTAGLIDGLSTARFSKVGVNGTGRLLSIKFKAKKIGEAQVTLANLAAGAGDLTIISLSPPEITITVEAQPDPIVDGSRLSFAIDSSVETPIRVDDTFILHLNTEEVTKLAGWICDIEFDPEILEVREVREGNFLHEGGISTFFLENTVDNTNGKITGLGAVRFSKEGISGAGTLLSLTCRAKGEGETEITISNLFAGSSDLVPITLSIPEFSINVEKRLFPPWDVNQDGQVDILDILHVAQYLREEASVNPQSDVDGDGMIGILDLIAVAQHINDSTSAAPTMITNQGVEMNPTLVNSSELTPELIHAWITEAMLKNDGATVFRKAIANLQRLLASLTPEKTKLLANYPNPFNPETWIPYHLARPSEVSIRIYNANGHIIRTLVLGHQNAGIYQSRSRSAYWDGKNDLGETVASGVFFYTLTAGNFVATRKMLVIK